LLPFRIALLETRLAAEVQEAVHSDPMYGPEHDKHRHFIGVEYEVALERQLASMGEFPGGNSTTMHVVYVGLAGCLTNYFRRHSF
jgi:hypothetical protein